MSTEPELQIRQLLPIFVEHFRFYEERFQQWDLLKQPCSLPNFDHNYRAFIIIEFAEHPPIVALANSLKMVRRIRALSASASGVASASLHLVDRTIQSVASDYGPIIVQWPHPLASQILLLTSTSRPP